jgi:molybdopterin biosynthesis enzyme
MRDSSALAAMAASNCLIDRPIGADRREMGEILEFICWTIMDRLTAYIVA